MSSQMETTNAIAALDEYMRMRVHAALGGYSLRNMARVGDTVRAYKDDFTAFVDGGMSVEAAKARIIAQFDANGSLHPVLEAYRASRA